LERLFEVFVGSTEIRSREETSPTDVILRSAASATHSRRDVPVGDHPDKLLVVVIGSEPMCSSRISRAASTTDADALIERGSSVIASRTLFAMVPPLVFMCDLSPVALRSPLPPFLHDARPR